MKTPKFGDARVPATWWPRIQADPETGCWLWTGPLNRHGYGYATLDGKKWRAHRLVYERLVAKIGEGLTLDHLCRVRNCVNPLHLEPCTVWENTRRGDSPTAIRARRTHCPAGHPLAGDNLTPVELRRGSRECLICHQERVHRIAQERNRTFAEAARKLGVTRTVYRATYGHSIKTAQAILDG